MENNKKNNKGCIIIAMLLVGLLIGMALCSVPSFVLAMMSLDSLSSNYKENVVQEGGEQKIVIIDVKGEITNQNSSAGLFSSGVASTPTVISQIQNAMNDESVVGIIIDMDSPGGDIVASDIIFQKLKDARMQGLFVVTSMQTLGASGGYYVACASDKIIANEMTITGSIGVYSVYQDVSGLYEKIGINQRVIKSGEMKTGEGLFDDDDDGVEDRIHKTIVEDAHNKFKEIVSSERGISLAQMDRLGDGRIYTGKQAVDNGLVDQLGNIEDAVRQINILSGNNNLTVVRYYTSNFWSDVLLIFNKTNLESILYNLAKGEQGVKFMYRME
jgi:protease-4